MNWTAHDVDLITPAAEAYQDACVGHVTDGLRPVALLLEAIMWELAALRCVAAEAAGFPIDAENEET